MRIDIILDPDTPPDEVTELGLLAERLGFGAVWNSNYPSSRDPFMNLVPLALASSRIRLGPIVVTPYELHPYKIAKALASLNELSDGRANILTGGPTGVNAAMGMNTKSMVGRVRECLEILNGISHEAPLNYEGDHYQVWNFRPDWATQPPPQVYVGANRQQMLGMAAGTADRIMFGDPTVQRLQRNFTELDEHLQSHGRQRSDVSVSALIPWHVKSNEDDSLSEATSQLALRGMLDEWFLEAFMDPDEIKLVEDNRDSFFRAYKQKQDKIEGVPETVVNKLVDNLTMAGDPDSIDQHINTLKAYAELGLDEVAFKLHGDQAEAVKLIGERVVPAFEV